jgi:hypothetical protein
MRTAIEMIEGLHYKLRMFGVEIDGPCSAFGDNQAVISNVVAPESQLKKKHAAISYHRVREAIAAQTVRVAKEHTSTNFGDLLMKCVSGPTFLRCLSRSPNASTHSMLRLNDRCSLLLANLSPLPRVLFSAPTHFPTWDTIGNYPEIM